MTPPSTHASLLAFLEAVPVTAANELLRERVHRALPTMSDAEARRARRAVSFWPTAWSARPLEEPFAEWLERRLREILEAAARRASLAMSDGCRLRQPAERERQAQALAADLNRLNDSIRALWRVPVDLPRWDVGEHAPAPDESESDREYTVGSVGFGCLFLYGAGDGSGRIGWGPAAMALEPPEVVARELAEDPHGLLRVQRAVPGSWDDLEALREDGRLTADAARAGALLLDVPAAG